MSDTTSDQEEVYPLSPEAVAAREKVRAMVNEMEEAERSRRVAEEQVKPDEQKEKAIDKLVKVQEDLIRFINLKKVKEAEEIERAQRITTEKKRDVHDELIRKAVQKEILKDEEKERARRIEESQDTSSDTQKERMKTYDRLVLVQEDLLRHMRKIQADTALKESQQEEIAHMNKAVVQEELLHQVKRQEANKAYKEEQDRQIEELEHLTPAEIEQRLSIASKLMEVQKQLLETHQPAKAIPEHHTDKMLEDFKIYMQEQLVRKANQKEAIEAMEGERKRRIAEGDSKSPTRKMSDQQAAVLEDITRKANTKQAKMLFEETQQQYILAEQKARAQEEAVRHINQKQVDKAMDEERQERVSSMEGKPSPKIDPSLKKDISQHASSK